MNRLELCRLLASKCGISGVKQLVTTLNQSGEFLSVVNWIDEAWNDLQIRRPDWDWMRSDFAFQTIADKATYTPQEAGISDLSRWHQQTFRAYLTSKGVADDSFMYPMGWPDYRDQYQFGVQRPGKPSDLAVRPRGSLLHLGPTPDDVYTVYGEYHRSAAVMTADADVPELPADYHMLILHGARMKYAADENASEVMAEASADYDRMLFALVGLQTEEISLGSPLA